MAIGYLITARKKSYRLLIFYENKMDTVFEATAEAVEEAIISSLYHADGMTGIRDKTIHGLKEYL